MSFKIHGEGYLEQRTLFQIDSLYKWKHEIYFPPVIVEVNPISICNHKCIYCYNAGRTTGKMNKDFLLSLPKKISKAGIKSIIFQGAGEPFLHPDLPEMIELCGKNNLDTCMVTNMSLFNNEKQEKALKYLTYIKMSSLDRDPIRYSYIHGCKEEDWYKTIKNIETAVKIRERDNLKVLLMGTFYLMKDNFKDLFNVVNFLKSLGIDYLSIQEPIYSEYSYIGKQPLDSSYFTEEQINELKEKVYTLKDDNFNLIIRFPMTDSCFTNGRDKNCWLENWCQGINFHAIIDSDGEIYPCYRYWGLKEYSYGNLKNKTFKKIWKSKRKKELIEFTNKIPPKKDECINCSVPKINEFCYRIIKSEKESRWKNFLV